MWKYLLSLFSLDENIHGYFIYITADACIEHNNARNAALNQAEVNLRLLCGADLLESFGTPGLWKDEDVSKSRYLHIDCFLSIHLVNRISICFTKTLSNFIVIFFCR